ncbi:MAG TPA: antibiotic biosynthesis monooxygenase [Pseudoneobacillus sp.]|nr:antibiotic biosynthesis monooxygenase [Pseudoneobacillus sp.]
MKIHITVGTPHFLYKKMQNHSAETMLLMENTEQAVLIHETNGASIFNEPRSFDILASKGQLIHEGFVVMHHFNVTEEGKPLFEYRLKDSLEMLDTQAGLLAIRCLRPLQSRTYMIVTIWDNEGNFQKWKNSKGYEQFQLFLYKDSGIDSIPNIFSNPSSISTYYTSAKED